MRPLLEKLQSRISKLAAAPPLKKAAEAQHCLRDAEALLVVLVERLEFIEDFLGHSFMMAKLEALEKVKRDA